MSTNYADEIKKSSQFSMLITYMLISGSALMVIGMFLYTLFNGNFVWIPFFGIALVVWGYQVPLLIHNKEKKEWTSVFLITNLVLIVGFFLFTSPASSNYQYFDKSTGDLISSSRIVTFPWEKEEDRYEIVPFSYNKIEVQLSYMIPSESQNKEIIVNQTATIFSNPLTFGAYEKLQEIQKIATLSISVGGENKEEVRNRVRESFLREMKIPEKEAEVSILGI